MPPLKRGKSPPEKPVGVALLMVIIILAGLIALVAPFVFSMVLHGRSARGDLNALHAREGAQAAVAHALSQLHKTLPYNFNNPGQLSLNGPEVTTLGDLKISMDFPAASEAFNRLELNIGNPDGVMWSARAEDEQGKINLSSAPATLLGNLLGSSTLTESTGRDANALPVDNPQEFYSDGDPSTVDGTVCIGTDWLRYKDKNGSSLILSEPTRHKHAAGELVYDGRAKEIVEYKFNSGGNGFAPFRSVFEIKAAIDPARGRAISPDEFARIERHLTIQSGLDGPQWGHAEQVLGGNFNGNSKSFNVELGDGFVQGMLVSFIKGGQQIAYGVIENVAPTANNGFAINLDYSIGVSSSGGSGSNDKTVFVATQTRHPININTASREVIEACVMGVCMSAGSETITREAAANLAAHLTDGNPVYTDQTVLLKALEMAYAKGILTAQQRDAVFINATEPNSPKLKTSTVTFCYHSFGSYTIEGSGIINAENGTQLARHTLRQLVTLPTPGPGRFMIEHQSGFEKLIEQGDARRVVTFPMPMGKYKNKQKSPALRLGSRVDGGARLDIGDSADDVPGKTLEKPWVEHCEDENDPGYRQDGYDLRLREPFVLPPVPPRRNDVATQPASCELWYKPMGGGQCVFYDEGLEDERNRVTFSYESANGLVIRIYDAGLECQDSNQKDFKHLKRNPVEFIYPARLDSGEWYHIAGSWKTSHYNGQEARLDAQLIPQDNPLKITPGTHLASDLSLDEVDSLQLEEAENEYFPSAGAVQIGEEIIEYTKRNGNALEDLRRGVRMSAIAKHKSGEIVVPYGYSNDLTQDLPVGGATLVERIEKSNMTNTQVNMPVPPNKIPFVLESDVQKIPVQDATDFPPSGFILVSGELIYYGKRSATTFEQLLRGQSCSGKTAPPRNLRDNAGVQLASMEITNSAQYDANGIVQIDDEDNEKLVEWIHYADKQIVNGKHYLLAQVSTNIGTISVGNPPTPVLNQRHLGLGSFRNYFGIGKGTIGRESAHAKKAKVIPVVRMHGPHCGDQKSPYGDNGVSTVSVVERGAIDGDLRWIKQAYIRQHANSHNIGPRGGCPAQFDSWGFDFYIGLNDFVSRRFPKQQTRLLKWPSGELPDAVNAQRHICSDRAGEGKVQGYVDELKVAAYSSLGGRIAMNLSGLGIAAGDEEILIEEFDAWASPHGQRRTQLNWPATGGLVRIEDELIFYTSAKTEQMEYYADVFSPLRDNPPEGNKADRRWVNHCSKVHELHPNIQTKSVMRLQKVLRGVLGSKAEDHPPGAEALVFDGMPVSLLKSQVTDRSDSFSVLNGAGFPKEGYALIDQEVISWQKRKDTSFTGCEFFHGRFGTSASEHEPDEIVRCLPFRYWDRETSLYDGTGLAYVQAGYYAEDAVWDGIELEFTGTEDRPRPNCVLPRMLVRFNGKPGWDEVPTNQEGGLYVFEKPGSHFSLHGLHGSGVKANQIDIRLYWDFFSGAFHPGSDWKRTFTVESLRATYHSPLIMRRLDEIEKR